MKNVEKIFECFFFLILMKNAEKQLERIVKTYSFVNNCIGDVNTKKYSVRLKPCFFFKLGNKIYNILRHKYSAKCFLFNVTINIYLYFLY